MLAFHFIKYWLFEIWFWESANIFEFVENSLKTIFTLITGLLILIVDLILGPIEIIAIIIYNIKKWRINSNDNRNKNKSKK